MVKADSDFKFQGYDLEPAITARRFMTTEYHSRQEVYDNVYFPTDKLLQELGKKPPAQLTTIASQPAILTDIWQGKRVNTDLILPNKKVVFLAHVMDIKLSKELWEDYKKNCKSQPQKYAALLRTGFSSIRRDSWLCAVPTFSDTLTPTHLTEAVRRYFDRFAPNLCTIPLCWLNDTNQSLASAIQRELTDHSRKLASPSIQSIPNSELIKRMQEDDDDFTRHFENSSEE